MNTDEDLLKQQHTTKPNRHKVMPENHNDQTLNPFVEAIRLNNDKMDHSEQYIYNNIHLPTKYTENERKQQPTYDNHHPNKERVVLMETFSSSISQTMYGKEIKKRDKYKRSQKHNSELLPEPS